MHESRHQLLPEPFIHSPEWLRQLPRVLVCPGQHLLGHQIYIRSLLLLTSVCDRPRSAYAQQRLRIRIAFLSQLHISALSVFSRLLTVSITLGQTFYQLTDFHMQSRTCHAAINAFSSSLLLSPCLLFKTFPPSCASAPTPSS